MVAPATTVIRGSLNTVSAGQPGGNLPDELRIKQLIQVVDALEPWQTPILDKIGAGPDINVEPFYFGQRSRVPLETTVDGKDADSADPGTLTELSASNGVLSVAAGTGAIMHKNAKLKVSRVLANGQKDPANYEIMFVYDTPTGDSVPVVRGFSGTTPLTFDTGSVVEIIGSATAQNQPFALSPVSRGFQFANSFERFSGGVAADKAAQNMPTHEYSGNPFVLDFEAEVIRQKILLQRTILDGSRSIEDAAIPLPGTMAGIKQFIVSNVVNLAQAPLTYRIFEDVLTAMWYQVDLSASKTIACSMRTAQLIDTLFAPLRSAYASTDGINFQAGELKFRAGTYPIEVYRDFPEGEIWVVDWSNIKKHARKGCNWQISERKAEMHGVPYDEKYIWGDFSISVQRERTMARIYNFSTDFAQYPQYGVVQTKAVV